MNIRLQTWFPYHIQVCLNGRKWLRRSLEQKNSEWATDIITSSSDKLSGLMDSLLRHAHMTGTSTRVLRYLDRPLTKTGKPERRSSLVISFTTSTPME